MTSPPSIPEMIGTLTRTLDTAVALAEDLGDAPQAGARLESHVPLCGATGAAPPSPACVAAVVRRGARP